MEMMEGHQAGDGAQPELCKRKREITGVGLGTAGVAEDFATQVTPLPADGWVTVPREGLALPSPPAGPWLSSFQQSRRDPSIQLQRLGGTPARPSQARSQGEDEQ